MSKNPIILELESAQLKEIPSFQIGDTVEVHQKLTEGEKSRIQVFTGTVIARKGAGIAETVTIHRIAYSEGMERTFMLHNPTIQEIKVVRQGIVRRAKLYYLRGTYGKAARVRTRLGGQAKKKKIETTSDTSSAT